jgi:ABC-type uncharacterized transport system ATPase subunit
MCTLLHRPQVLVLDEPANGLDPISRRDLCFLLYRLSKEGTHCWSAVRIWTKPRAAIELVWWTSLRHRARAAPVVLGRNDVDPMARRAFWDLIYQLAGAGRGILVTTHYMDEAAYCDRLALMHGGKIVALNDPPTLKKELRSHAVLRLESADPIGSMRALENEPYILDILRIRDRPPPDCPWSRPLAFRSGLATKNSVRVSLQPFR